jgi:hypothetical protein
VDQAGSEGLDVSEPLWRGPAGVLGSLLDLKGATGVFGVGVDDQVAVVRVDSLPTRDQIEQATGALAFLLHTTTPTARDQRVAAFRDVLAVMALFGQTEGETP